MDEKTITFKGAPLKVTGKTIKVGDKLPAFKLTGVEMNDVTSDQFVGKPVIVISVPSLDTPVCSMETKRFNDEAKKKGVPVVVVSRDLPFAMKRWCGAEDATHVVPASDYKYQNFGKEYGVFINDWGLLARAVFIADASGAIKHVEYVSEVSAEPNYDAALEALG